MIEELEPVSETSAGRYLVAETGAVVKVQFDLDESGYVIDDQYEVYEQTVTIADDGWQCECETVDEPVSFGETDEYCTHITEARKVERVLFQ